MDPVWSIGLYVVRPRDISGKKKIGAQRERKAAPPGSSYLADLSPNLTTYNQSSEVVCMAALYVNIAARLLLARREGHLVGPWGVLRGVRGLSRALGALGLEPHGVRLRISRG
jgi:hypothetical protein